MNAFHSAVNRIPVLRDSAKRLEDDGRLPSGLFADGQAGHDHIAADRWSGTIDVRITVKTPLVFGEQSRSDDPRQALEQNYTLLAAQKVFECFELLAETPSLEDLQNKAIEAGQKYQMAQDEVDGITKQIEENQSHNHLNT